MKYRILLVFLAAILCVNAAAIAKLVFVKGDVQYQEGIGGGKIKAGYQMRLSENAYLILGPAAEATILFDSGEDFKLSSSGRHSIQKIYQEVRKKDTPLKWLQKVVNGLNITYKSDSSFTEAGIRRDKHEAQSADTLLWGQTQHYNVGEAVKLFEDEKYEEALELFEKVIEQDPLHKEAELSHGFIVLICEELDLPELRGRQIELMSADFPESGFLELID